MAVTSSMLPLGTKAPEFKLLDTVTNKIVSLQDLKSNIATVIMFLCNHCPYVKYIQPALIDLVKAYQAKNISFIAINSNDPTSYPEDGPNEMAKEAKNKKFTFPYLFDDSQEVAKAYHAACTPDFYVFDKDLKCIYRGRFDDANPSNQRPATGNELKRALDLVLQGKAVDANQKPSIGCSIKWKKNN